MAIAFDNAAQTATTGAANSRTLLLTATAGAVLLVCTNVPNTQSVSAINVGANALTRLGTCNYRADYGEFRTEMWGLTAPPSGTLTISAHLTPGSPGWGMAAVTYVGHRTTATPFGGTVVSSATATGSTRLVISATTGDHVVGSFACDEVNLSPTGATKRIQTSAWAVMVCDNPGATNVTISCTSTIGTVFGNIGIHLIASSGAATITGSMSATDAADTFAATAKTIVSGRLSATEATTDTFAASAANRITARLSATEAFSDAFSAAAKTRITARLSATDITDTFLASAAVRVTGRLSATDVTDTFASSANVRVTGRLSATDVTDTFASSAQTIVTGRLSATDAQDTFLANATDGTVARSATVAMTDAADTFAATAYTVIQARLSATDAPDVFLATTPSTARPDPGAGGGKRRKSSKPPYIQAGHDFWDARERYLQSLQPEITVEPEPEFFPETPAIVESELPQYDPGQLITYSIKRTELIAALPTATTMRQLRSYGDELRKINRLILRQKLMRQLIEQVARREERQRRIARKRRILATLQQAYELLSLLHPQ